MHLPHAAPTISEGNAFAAAGGLTLTLSSSENNVLVRTRLGNPSGVRTITIKVDAGVEIGSASTTNPALDFESGWDAGCDFIIDFQGETDNRIQGKGGDGGRGAADTGSKSSGAGGGGGGGAGREVGGSTDGGAGGQGPGAATDGADGTKDAAGAGGSGTVSDPGFGQIQMNGSDGGTAVHNRGFPVEVIGGKIYGGGGGGAGGGVNESGGNGGEEGQDGVDTTSATGGSATFAIEGGGAVTQTSTPDIRGDIEL